MNKNQFINYLKEQIDRAGSQKEYAEKIGVSPQYLCDVINNRREPGKKILDAVEFIRTVEYWNLSSGDKNWSAEDIIRREGG